MMVNSLSKYAHAIAAFTRYTISVNFFFISSCQFIDNLQLQGKGTLITIISSTLQFSLLNI